MTETHTSRAHAKLAPSAAHRWVACPGSIRMSEGIEQKSSVYAAEGTAAHSFAAYCLDLAFNPKSPNCRHPDGDPVNYLGWVIEPGALDPDKMFSKGAVKGDADGVTTFAVDEEMVEAVEAYLVCIFRFIASDKDADVQVEQRLDMKHIHPDCFGTGDATVYRESVKWLHVFDFKYGKGVAVDPDTNPQLLLYGMGAARRYHNKPLSGITLHIVQPRAPGEPVKSWRTNILELFEHEARMQLAAMATEAADAPLNAGEWCRFCPAMPTCPVARDKARGAAMAEFADAELVLPEPAQLTVEQRVTALREAEYLGNWIKAVQEWEHAEAVAGRGLPGYKLVAKRALRKWKDEAAVKDVLVLEYDMSDEDIHTEPKLKSPAQLEKLFPGKNKDERQAEMAALVKKESSGTNLVLESDPRPAVKADGVAEFSTEGT